jgi:hypothetical protein
VSVSVHFELGEDGEDVEEHLAHRVGRIVEASAEEEFDAAGDQGVADVTGVGTERASRSSFGTTRVSPARTVARAWSRPERARLVPVSPLSR